MVWVVVIQERSGKDLTDYQVRVEVTDPDFFSECTEQKYVEFYDSDKTTLLSHYTEIFDVANNKAVFWVKVPSIPANGTKTIYLNVNTERTEDLSDGEATFDFWDDFEGDSLDTNKWNVIDATGFSVSNSLLKGTDTTGVIHSIQAFTPETCSYALEILLKPVTNATNGFTAGGFYKSTTDGLTYLKHPDRDFIRNDDAWNNLGSEKMALNVFNKLIVIAKPDGNVDVKVIRTDTGETTYQATWTNTVSDEVIRLGRRADDDFTGRSYMAYWDWVRVRKYTEPEPSVTVAKVGATATLDFKRIVAKALAGKIANILNGDPRIRLYSGGSLVKEITAGAKLRKEDTANKWFIVMFLFVDDSSDAYTTDSQELIFPHPDGDYVAFTQSESFEKIADEPLPLRWEIYIPWVAEDFGWG